jgi:hypothetical protein
MGVGELCLLSPTARLHHRTPSLEIDHTAWYIVGAGPAGAILTRKITTNDLVTFPLFIRLLLRLGWFRMLPARRVSFGL